MSKYIAVEGCTIEYDTDPSSTDLSLVTTLSAASQKVKSGGNGAYKDKLSITVLSGQITLTTPPSGASSGTSIAMVGGVIDIDGTSQKSQTEGDVFVLEEDEGDSTFVFTFPQQSGPSPIPANVKITAKVSKAGQNVLKAT